MVGKIIKEESLGIYISLGIKVWMFCFLFRDKDVDILYRGVFRVMRSILISIGDFIFWVCDYNRVVVSVLLRLD